MCEYHMEKVVEYLNFKIGVQKRNIEQIELYIRTQNANKKLIEAEIEKLNGQLEDIKMNMAQAQSNLMAANTKLTQYSTSVTTLEELINN